MPEEELDQLIAAEKDANTAFNRFAREQVTCMYPNHFVLVWSKGLYPQPPALFGTQTYSYEAVHDCLFTYDELPEAFRIYSLDVRIAQAKQKDLWVSSYVEAQVWDPDIREEIRI